MGYRLTGELRGRLRGEIYKAITRDAFVLFASDKLDIPDFKSMVAEAGFELQLQEFLIIYEVDGLARLCNELRLFRPRAAKLVKVVDEILKGMAAYSETTGSKNAFIVGGRLFLDREDLRDRIDVFAGGSGIERLLVVSGEPASGKSHSSILITHGVDAAKPVAVDLPATAQGEFTAEDVAGAITARIWPARLSSHFDDLKQQARDGKLVGDELVQRLSTLDEPTLLVVDRFDSARLAPAAKELLIRLCRALELRECPHLWLVLIGLDVADLAPSYDSVVEPDLARAPGADDIAEFLVSVAERGGKSLETGDVKPDADNLVNILGPKPTYDSWRAFEKELKQVSTRLKEGGTSGG
jgi:hypothetical protein